MAKSKPGISEETRKAWTKTYAETPYHDLPWFSPRPYPYIVEAARDGWWHRGTRILDLGCGAGTNSLFFARAGFKVSGIDLAQGAIEAARSRARKAQLSVDFRVGDVLRLPFPRGYFGGAIDIGCFHTLPTELRRAYSKELARVLHPRRTFALSWIAREYRGSVGPPHRPSLEEITEALEDDFLFLRTEYRASYTGRPVGGAPPVYCALLGRRSLARPKRR